MRVSGPRKTPASQHSPSEPALIVSSTGEEWGNAAGDELGPGGDGRRAAVFEGREARRAQTWGTRLPDWASAKYVERARDVTEQRTLRRFKEVCGIGKE